MQEHKQLAVITGASSGIGADLAREFARAGYQLIISARREAVLRQLADELNAIPGCRVQVVAADLATVEGSEADGNPAETSIWVRGEALASIAAASHASA